MPWLTLTAGPTGTGSYSGDFQTDGAQEGAPTLVGSEVRAFDGTLRSTVRAAARNWTLKTPPLSPTDYDALKAVLGLGPCSMNGVITDDTELPVVIHYTTTQVYEDMLEATDTAYIVTLAIQEITAL